MLESFRDGLTLATLLGSGLMAGTFFAFSTFVMKALARLPAPQGIAAMQSINVAVINPLFMLVFLGTAILSVALVVLGLVQWQQPGSGYLLASAALYLLGTFGVTIAFNVPLNNALAVLIPTDPASAQQWADYVSEWTLWNHVRTLAPLAGVVLLALGLRR